MRIRRILLVIISIAIGAGITLATTLLIGTTPAEYGFWYFFFTAASIAVAVGIWLDKFMKTEILPK